MEEPRDYKIKFAVINAEDIDDLVVIGNDHFGTVKVPAGATIYGTRPVVPPNDRVAYMTQRNDFYLHFAILFSRHDHSKTFSKPKI